jgi:hypothetical protein
LKADGEDSQGVFPMHVKKLMLMALTLLLLSGCGADQSLEGLRKGLDRYPEYSVILADMDSRGIFVKDYLQRYLLLYSKNGSRAADANTPPPMEKKLTNWVSVDRSTYERYHDALGMTILAKKRDGTIDTVPQPPAYQYVGDTRFGSWEKRSDGTQAWAWMAAGAVLSHAFDELTGAYGRGRRPIDYGEWQDYRKSTSKGEPYFGRKDSQGKPQFGTGGEAARSSNPGFFERQQTRMAQQKESFADKVESRMGRSKVAAGSSSFSSKFSMGRKSRR